MAGRPRALSWTEGRVRSADGTSIGFLKLGSGPGLVFSHGSLSTGEDWLPVAARLAPRFTCYVMSRRGRGRSESGPGRSLEAECEDLAAVLGAAGARAHLLGHSYGAICALEAARRSRVAGKLVLYEPPLPIERPAVGPELETYRTAVAAGRYEEALRTGFRSFVRLSEEEIEALRNSFTWQQAVTLAPTWVAELETIAALEPGVERFSAVLQSTLLLIGTETAPHHRTTIEALERVLPSARTQNLEGQGHTAHITVPGRVAAAIEGFLVEVDERC